MKTHEHRISPEPILELKDKEVFVFGSNEGGFHGKGAAKQAMTWGAVWRQAEGLQGRTYGIPTKDKAIKRTLTIGEIKPYVDRFIAFAKTREDLTFLVTEVGCGLAGLKPKDVAPLFKDAIEVENIHLPKRFWHKLESFMNESKLQKVKEEFKSLTDKERLDIFAEYCIHCGQYDGDKLIKCKCWNDE